MTENFHHFIGIIHENSRVLVAVLVYPKHNVKNITLSKHVLMPGKTIEKMMVDDRG